jgi:K+-sensing histidine kinase KdpD
LDVEVIDIVTRVALEKFLLMEQTEGKSFKALIESLDVLLAVLLVSLLRKGPIKDITCIQDLLLFHFFVIAPNASFDEMDLHFLLPFVLD